MAVLYIDKIHGLPDLDLKLEISGNSVTATLYSANDYGGYFYYPSGIEYYISAGGTGFSINSGEFSYTTSGEVIKTQTGTIGSGSLTVYGTCHGGGSGCFSSDDTGDPAYNSSKSSGIDTSKLIVHDVASSYLSSLLNNTLIVEFSGLEEPPSNLNFSGQYIELGMSSSFTLGTGTFQSFTVSPRSTSGGDNIATWSKDYSGWTFTDSELLTIYNNLGAQPYGEQQMYLYLTVTTTHGSVSGSFGIKVGGTSWRNESGTWKREVPYIRTASVWEPTIMYRNINGSWKRGNP